MNDKDNSEDFLKGFSLKPPPGELREKIVDSVFQKRKAILVMSPGQWKILIASGAIIVFSFVLDAGFNHIQKKQMASLLNSSHISQKESLLAQDEFMDEIFGHDSKERWISQLEWRMTKNKRKVTLNTIQRFLTQTEEINED